MESNEFLSSSHQPAEPTSSLAINELSDGDLAGILKYLLPYERLLIGGVCTRWHRISGLDWLEIFDLSQIPGPHIAGIIKHSPNLQSVFAVRKTFNTRDLHILPIVSLDSVKLYDCSVVIPPINNRILDPFSAIFSGIIRTANWDELVLHNLSLVLQNANVLASKIKFPASLPTSLKRLQISGLKFSNNPISWSDACYDFNSLLRGIEQLRALECLILHSTQGDDVVYRSLSISSRLIDIVSLQNLRELYLSKPCGRHLWWSMMALPKLEALFLHNFHLDLDGGFTELTTAHPSLRILCLTGNAGCRVIDFPARMRYGNGLDSAPLPLLHVFVGALASVHIRFPQLPADAAKVYPISEPLARFLDRTDIRPIFDGVWIAAKIKEAAKNGAKFHEHEEDDITAYLRLSDNRFIQVWPPHGWLH